MCRFASPGSFGMKMYHLLLRINQQYPDLTIHFAYASNPAVLKDVLEERIDVGFVSCAVEDASLSAEPFDEERLCLAVPKSVQVVTWA
ncbi:LysR family transcriptional regulator substrate-binding protein, partial [Klebsiella pneumoniae]